MRIRKSRCALHSSSCSSSLLSSLRTRAAAACKRLMSATCTYRLQSEDPWSQAGQAAVCGTHAGLAFSCLDLTSVSASCMAC